jgi:hypothetical protein
MADKPKKKAKKTTATMASPTQVPKAAAKGAKQAGKPKTAGSSKAATITRQMQNKGVKEGTVRLGRGGKFYNVYDEKTGTWKRAVAKKTEATKKAPSRSGNKKEAGLVNRPTKMNPSYGAEQIVGGTKNQPRYGNVIVNPSRRQSKAPRVTRVPKKDR